MKIIHHSKDSDGNTSGAICKYRYPDAELIGWDYADPIPDFGQFGGQEVIMIDVSFPLKRLIELGNLCNLTLIDHHISLKKEIDQMEKEDPGFLSFTYIYEDGIAACEIGWKYLFPERPIPWPVLLVSKYDTWREYGTEEWENNILPFKYGVLSIMNSPESFPVYLFDHGSDDDTWEIIATGRGIVQYEQKMNSTLSKSNGFVLEAYNGLRALCLNVPLFSSEVMKDVYNEDDHDIMIGFVYTGRKWSVSLRSTKPDVDVSIIAKERGGGGHKAAAGFEVDNFTKIFI